MSRGPTFDLMTSAKVKVLNCHGEWIPCRILLDTCSTANFISETFVNLLGLPKRKCMFSVDTLLTQSNSAGHMVDVKLRSIHNEFQKELSLLTISRIGQKTPSETVPREALKIPPNLQLADPEFHKPAEIQMLIGSGPTASLLAIGQINLSQGGQDLYLQKTKLGWVVAGSVTIGSGPRSISCHLASLEDLLTRFWEIEEVNADSSHNPIFECPIEKHFKQTTERDVNGRFIVALPFKGNKNDIGESRTRAAIQLRNLKKKFNRDPGLKNRYGEAMQQYVERGYMSVVKDSNWDEGYYMPHHAVMKESSLTTKTRIVFNCSAPSSTGVSLNNILHKGPVIQNSSFLVHLRFRTYPVVVMGDIQKMYLQVQVREEDRKFQRALWFEGDKIITLQSNTLTFGQTPAPYLAIRCIQQLATEHKSTHPLGSQAIEKETYVDNVATGAHTISQAIQTREEVTKILANGCFRIHQWASNRPEVLAGLDETEINSELDLNSDGTVNMLGVRWEARRDWYIYSTIHVDRNSRVTKRIILSVIARIYDPLGLLNPITMYAKLILQEVWEAKLDWDESVPQSIYTMWLKFCEQLNLIHNFAFERLVLIASYWMIWLLGFCDASEKGYGACLYILSSGKGKTVCKLLCGKSRVAPIKKLTIARLELNGAKLLVSLYNEVKDQIGLKFDRILFWSDSTTVIQWIRKSPSEWKTYVANRVAFIQNTTTPSQWRHVRGEENPADCLSRGQLPRDFIDNQLYRNGPSWINLPENQWPTEVIKPLDDFSESKTHTTLLTTVTINPVFERFSSYRKLLKRCAIYYRVLAICKKRVRFEGSFAWKELRETEIRIIRYLQSTVYAREIKALKTGEKLNFCKILQLSPIFDCDGLVRVGGRLKNADHITYGKRHPILLPSYNHVTDLIIDECHKLNKHCGIQTTLSILRNKFWLMDGRNQVRRVIRRCITCFRANPVLGSCQMGELPKLRTQRERPFKNVGVDYCGPFLVKERIKNNRSTVKVYVAIFICMVVKAVHFEVVYDLTSEAFIASLSNFVSRRGYPSTISSDNATNFKGANRELREVYELLHSENHKSTVKSWCDQRNIEWIYIPPLAPNFGGLWESAVKMFKHHLLRVAKNVLLSKDHFNSLVVGIEAIVNSRPITPLSNDPNDIQALTPGHFLIGDSLTCLPELDLLSTPTNRLSLWQHVLKLKQDFWQQWNKEYLNTLNVRRKWREGNKNLEVGALVLLKESNLPTMQWAMGRITQVFPGKDGIVRTVTVKTTKGDFKRSVRHLAPLPIDRIEKSTSQGGECVPWKCIKYRHYN